MSELSQETSAWRPGSAPAERLGREPSLLSAASPAATQCLQKLPSAPNGHEQVPLTPRLESLKLSRTSYTSLPLTVAVIHVPPTARYST